MEVTLIDHMGTDLSVVNAARVSFGEKSKWEGGPHPYFDPVNLKLSYKDKKLIKYLAEHKHVSPFGHCFASFHIKAPVFVARQLEKHKFLRWNEISCRYVDSEPEFYKPKEWRGRSEDKKQGRRTLGNPCSVLWMYHEGMRDQRGLYNKLLEIGVAPEQARMILPQSTLTEWYWSGSLDDFADMCNLRCGSDTQYESRVVACQISDEMAELFPVSWKELTR